MKTLLSFLSGGAVVILVLFLIALAMPKASDECATIRASYDRTQDLYEQKLAQQDEIIQYTLARIVTVHEMDHTNATARFIWQQKATEVAKASTIEALAARAATIEKAAKYELTVKGIKAWIHDALPEYKPEWARALGRR